MADTYIGKYTIIKELSRGGMSTIYLAMHPDLNRRIAIKVMHPDLSQDPEFVQRFEQEARIIAKLEHPNILQVYDFGKQGDTNYFMAMEYVEGDDLEQLVRQSGPFPWEITVMLFHSIAQALQEAHQHGIIHRDLKLKNILLKHNGSVKLADFGISKDSELKNITRTRDLIGTPYYMAPELIRGLSSSIQSDIYGLGVCLYQTLTGKPPFDGPSIAAVFERITTGDYPTPSSHGMFVVKELEAIIRKCMAANPEERYSDVSLLAEELARLLYKYHLQNDKREIERYLKEPRTYLFELRGKMILRKKEEAEKFIAEKKGFEAIQAYKDLLSLDPENRDIEEKLLHLRDALPQKEGTQVIGEYSRKQPQSTWWQILGIVVAFLILLSGGILFYFTHKGVPEKKPIANLMPMSITTMSPTTLQTKQIEIIKPDTAVHQKRVNVIRKDTIQTITPTPVPDTISVQDCFGLLTVYSGVWADIYIDDRKLGRSPTKQAIKIPCGERVLRLENNSGNSYQTRITVDGKTALHLAVEKNEFK